MRFEEIRHRLDAVLSEVDSISEYINYGGCGVVAVSLHRTLTKLGFRPEIAKVHRSHDDWSEENWQDYYCGTYDVPHCMVYLEVDGDRWLIDSTGVHSAEELEEGQGDWYPVGMYRADEMYDRVRDRYGWNTQFDRALAPSVRGKISGFRKWAMQGE